MKGSIRALSLLLFFIALRAGAQPVQLSVGTDSACAAGFVEVPVTAAHFTGVAGFTLLIRFDTAAAGFDSVLWVHPLLDDTTLWGLHPFMDSVLSITWINFSNGSGINLPHGDTLFWLRFFLKAGSTALEVVLSPISAAYPDYSEFLNASVVALPLNASNGSLSLLSPPPILVEPQPAEVCLGDTAFFSVQSPQATTFQWQSAPLPGGPWSAVGAGTSGGQTSQLQVPGSASAWYRCIVSAECSDTSLAVQGLVNPLPNPSLSVDTTILAGQQAYLSAGGGVAYQWSHGTTTAQDTVTPLLTTAYSVTVTDGNGCSAADSGVVVVQNLPTVTLTLGNAVGCADTVLVPVIAQGLDSVAAMSLIIQIDTSQLNIASRLGLAMSG
ncbi:MAG: hypothetical protein IH599_03620, partial [Bacteroidales bacterium]|nr:hypothetical protein [Bacteroidales bacterium]